MTQDYPSYKWFFETRNFISLDEHVAFLGKRRVPVAKESKNSYPSLNEILFNFVFHSIKSDVYSSWVETPHILRYQQTDNRASEDNRRIAVIVYVCVFHSQTIKFFLLLSWKMSH